MHIITQTPETHEIDDSTETHYILSLKLSQYSDPIVITIEKGFDNVKGFLMEYNEIFKQIESDDPYDTATQKYIIQGVMMGIVQCIHRAGDDGVIEQLKEDEDTKFLFLPRENDIGNSKKVSMTSEREHATIDIEGMFKSAGLSGQEVASIRRSRNRKNSGADLKKSRDKRKASKQISKKSRKENK